MPKRLLLVVAALVIVAGGAFLVRQASPAAGSAATSGPGGILGVVLGKPAVGTNVGDVAPNFTLESSSGQKISLSSLRGKPVLINFWASWCGPCKAELPALEKVHQSFGSKAEVLGVNLTGEEVGQKFPSSFVTQEGLTYPILLDRTGEVAVLYQISEIPTTYIVNPRGVITQKITHRGDFSTFEDALKASG